LPHEEKENETMSYAATRIGSVGISPTDAQTLQVNTATGALLVDVSGTISFPDSVQINPLGIDQVTPGANVVASKPAASVKGTSVLTPAAASKAVSGAGGLGLTIISTVAKIVLWASAAGAYLAYNGAASSASIPIPTVPLTLDCNATDLALIQLIGDGSKTVFVVQQG
jgi:hypothetical protein